MKKREILFLIVSVAVLLGVYAHGAQAGEPGSSADPFISLDYLQNTFVPTALSQVEKRLGEKLPSQGPQEEKKPTSTTELRVKRGDLVTLKSGASATALAGSLWCSTGAGTTLDLTAGTELSSGPLVHNHRYLSAEDSITLLSVTSDTAVVRLFGDYQLAPSDQTDYNALANALKTLGLFRGGDVLFGSGYALEEIPTRIQGLIMFIRLLGEESAALAFSGGAYSFPDVPAWAAPYVAYAYGKGYTKGIEGPDGEGRVYFGTTNTLSGREYVTFLLRAMGYRDGEDFRWDTSVGDARTLGVLTDGEVALLNGSAFLRAQVAYLSFYAMEGPLAEGGRLMDRLTGANVIDPSTLSTVQSKLNTKRL